MGKRTTGGSRRQTGATLDEFLRARIRELIEDVLSEEVTEALGQPRRERGERCGYRHGTRRRHLTLSAGSVSITVPRARLMHPDGTHTEWRSGLLPRHRRMSHAAEPAVVHTYLAGGNTRRIRTALAPLLEGGPLSKSAVSRIVQSLQAAFDTWRTRSLTAEPMAYLYLDALYPRVRSAGRVIAMPVLVAVGVCPRGHKRLLALQTSGGETGAAWHDLMHDLAARGLATPRLIISDGNRGLKQALLQQWPDAPHQRCVIHKQRNVVSRAPKHVQASVRADFQTIIYATTKTAAIAARDHFVAAWRRRAPQAVASVLEAGDDLLTFHAFPATQHASLRSTNVIERLNEEFRRRIKTHAVCPTETSVLVLFYSLVANGAIRLKKISGWQDLPRLSTVAA